MTPDVGAGVAAETETETWTSALTLPAAKATLAVESALATVPPLVAETRPAAGGARAPPLERSTLVVVVLEGAAADVVSDAVTAADDPLVVVELPALPVADAVALAAVTVLSPPEPDVVPIVELADVGVNWLVDPPELAEAVLTVPETVTPLAADDELVGSLLVATTVVLA